MVMLRCTTARRTTRHRLRKPQMRVHARRWIQEKNLQQFGRPVGIARVTPELIGRAQRRHPSAQLPQRQPVVVEVSGVGLAIAPDVGQAVLFVRIGPPVITVLIEIVRTARAQLRAKARDGDRRQGECGAGRLQDALAVDHGHLNTGPRGSYK